MRSAGNAFGSVRSWLPPAMVLAPVAALAVTPLSRTGVMAADAGAILGAAAGCGVAAARLAPVRQALVERVRLAGAPAERAAVPSILDHMASLAAGRVHADPGQCAAAVAAFGAAERAER